MQAAAAGPVTEMPTLRCEMPTAECSCLTPAQSASGSPPASSITSHSSGPSQSAVRPSLTAEVFGALRQRHAERLGKRGDGGGRRAQRDALGRRKHGKLDALGGEIAAGQRRRARALRGSLGCSLSH